MKRTLNKTHKTLIDMFMSRGKMTFEEATKKADETIGENTNTIQYYVTTISYDLSDIQSGAMVKTPAEYFKNLEQAKIFQLNGILTRLQYSSMDSIHENYTQTEISDMKEELKDLSETFPEYVI